MRVFLRAILFFWVIASLTFFSLRALPGSPFEEEGELYPQLKMALEDHYGLQKPILEQYLGFLKRTLQGDLGFSLAYPRLSILDFIRSRLPYSLALGGMALFIVLFLGIPTGMVMGFQFCRGKWLRARRLVTFLVALPTFLVCTLFLSFFSMGWPLKAVAPHWVQWLEARHLLLPSGFWYGPKYWVLPVVCMSFRPLLLVIDLIVARFVEVGGADFIGALKAKGVGHSRLLWSHMWRPVLPPLVSFLGPIVAGMLTGSFVVETVFAIPGISMGFIQGIFQRDYPLIQGLVLVFSFILIFFNSLSDAWISSFLQRGDFTFSGDESTLRK